ncbi:hypothetical protein ACGF7W_19695 [Streptomyces sp. NPDC048219]|uniref:hypothetical protein n=1 Tax=Streptomyces sp. NPDC048219 TaxID=3365517 RepID=UPI003713F61D
MTTQYAQPWFEDLTDSVRALGEAAREYQLAYTTASTLRAGVDVDRRVLHDGKVAAQPRPGSASIVPVSRAPHEQALFALSSHYSAQSAKLLALYENAALCFASGCVWAISHVQAGHNPNGVLFNLGGDRGTLTPWRSLRIDGMDRYAYAKQLAAAYERLAVCLDAAGYAESLDAQDYVSDAEAGWMHEALDVAAGIPDAAYAYGLLAERALQFALLEPRRQYLRREVAEDAQQS